MIVVFSNKLGEEVSVKTSATRVAIAIAEARTLFTRKGYRILEILG